MAWTPTVTPMQMEAPSLPCLIRAPSSLSIVGKMMVDRVADEGSPAVEGAIGSPTYVHASTGGKRKCTSAVSGVSCRLVFVCLLGIEWHTTASWIPGEPSDPRLFFDKWFDRPNATFTGMNALVRLSAGSRTNNLLQRWFVSLNRGSPCWQTKFDGHRRATEMPSALREKMNVCVHTGGRRQDTWYHDWSKRSLNVPLWYGSTRRVNLVQLPARLTN